MLRRALPVTIMVLVSILLLYPLALLFGLPMARRDMADQRKWLRETVTAQPPLSIPEGATGVASLGFAADAGEGVLILNAAPLTGDPAGALPDWGAELTQAAPGVFSLGAPLGEAGPALYFTHASGCAAGMRWCLLQPGAKPPARPPDGSRTGFTFGSADGPVLLDGRVLQHGTDYTLAGGQVLLAAAPPFGSDLQRVSEDYAILDESSGLIILHGSLLESGGEDLQLRAAQDIVRLAPKLAGSVDGSNRTFAFPGGNMIESDSQRRLFRGDTLLSDTAERPQERVDGHARTFTFPGSEGLLVVNGELLEEGRDYTRDGNTVSFAVTPARNAQLRQYRDYWLTDVRAGQVLLAQAPAPGETVWTDRYSRYSQPSCGATVQECFLALPQHPVPFPHWIAQRIGPFFAKYPLDDERNVVRATLYTTLGTLAALLLGGAIGMILAVLFVLFRPLERALLPWTIASQTIPIIALVPVLLLVLGNFGITIQTSLLPTALVGAYICFFPVVVSTVKGLRAVEPLILDLMKSYAAGPLTVFWKVRFPAAVPFFFTGLKLGIAAALVGALVAETESNNRRGLGYQVLGQVQSGNVADVWILLLISGVLGIALVTLIGFLQRTLAPWERAP
jgi:NitT/TauT family transport system permease protein